MERVKTISQKLSDDTFSTPMPIGADAINIDLKEGLNLEEKVEILDRQIASKAPINHASPTQDYGLGEKGVYGHLKVSDVYTREDDKDPEHTVVSQKGIVDLFNSYLLNILKVFHIMDKDTVVSSLNTGWIRNNEEYKMWLLSDYFRIEEDIDGNEILITKDIRNERDGNQFNILGNSLIFYSINSAWVVNDAKIRLVSDYFSIGKNAKGETVLIIK